ncbi:hypothetical protein GOODEAATRI_023048 [Goodea atripinnis]|uniref:Uncharacterized protein n=1 Tax=Goodea atripinnis TaxID=208336 RepID=A0ABV0PR74_9TELE
MKISIVVGMDADQEIINTYFFFFFFHLTKKTGLQIHPTTNMQFTESKEEEKKLSSDTQPSSDVCFCYGSTSAGRKTLCAGWMEMKRWQMNGGDDNTYTCFYAKV